MSQSKAHTTLVKGTVKALRFRYANISMRVDLQENPGDEVPPKICGFKPDIYAMRNQGNPIIIAEAKTDRDIDNKHTRAQATSFIRYLEHGEDGLFILSVTGFGADRAKTVLHFIRKELRVMSTEIEVFDGCDFWRLDSGEGANWHLYCENRLD